MVHFKGEYHNRVDHKGRICLPARLRSECPHPEHTGSGSGAAAFVLLRGLDRCLYLYPIAHWQRIEARLSQINSFSDSGRKVLRRFLRFAEELSLDGQNRLALPPRLRKWAGIETSSTAIFIGSGERIELWAPAALAAEDETLDTATYQQLFETLMDDPEPPHSL
ncbi:MAG: division/cell wall cluster transcriptional repressor MraZ [Cyclonatronaceae bacterium]